MVKDSGKSLVVTARLHGQVRRSSHCRTNCFLQKHANKWSLLFIQSSGCAFATSPVPYCSQEWFVTADILVGQDIITKIT